MKHTLLVRLIRALQRKDGGFLYLDTHAGRGAYRLERSEKGDRTERRAEYPDGIGRLWSRTDLPAPVADYVEKVRSYDTLRGGRALPAAGKAPGPSFYPGSPLLASLLARPRDRLALCERQPAEFASLRRLLGRKDRVTVRGSDGYPALRALLPPPERRALVLIAPPSAEPDEDERIVSALEEGLRRFPRGVYAVWYPLTERMAAGKLLAGLRSLAPVPCLVADLIVDPEGRGLRGCGLAVLNPPWQFDGEAEAAVAWLARALAQAPRSSGNVRWLTSQSATSAKGG